jgi:hypothetical protein
MRLPVPGPRDVLHLVERGAEALDVLLSAAPRALKLLDEAGALLLRVDALLTGIEETRASAESVVLRTDGVVTLAEATLDRTEAAMSGAEAALVSTDSLTRRLVALLDATEPSLTRLQPTLERLAETTDPAEVDALVTLIDHLPVLAVKMETDIVPVLESLSSVAPDLHDLLDVSRELNELLAKLPGMGRLKRRVDEEQELQGRA